MSAITYAGIDQEGFWISKRGLEFSETYTFQKRTNPRNWRVSVSLPGKMIMSARTGFRLRKEEVLGLLLYGRLDQLVFRYLAFEKIDRTVKSGDKFGSEQAFTEWRRAEQRILYGRPLTWQQAARIEALNDVHGLLETDIVKLMSARAVTKDGQLKLNTRIHVAVACLSILVAMMTLIWLSVTGYAVSVKSDVSLVTVAAIICIQGVMVWLPTAFSAYCSLAPLGAFKRAIKAEG